MKTGQTIFETMDHSSNKMDGIVSSIDFNMFSLEEIINNLEQIIELKRGFLSKIFPKPKNLFSINK